MVNIKAIMLPQKIKAKYQIFHGLHKMFLLLYGDRVIRMYIYIK